MADEIRRLVLLACADLQNGRALRADDAVRRAVDIGRAEGCIRPFLEQGSQIVSLLRLIFHTNRDPYLAQLVSQAERSVPTSSASEPNTILLEPLAARERQVLSYLPSHLSCPAIAEKIQLSPNTVKTYMKAIYRKVGAGSRNDAVSIAVSRGWL
jgi:LuxR family transcriptional regulator, maltose regulon positive regulatory protein